jgi:hypothetical protein
VGEGEVEGNNDVVVIERKSLWGVVALSQRGRGRGRVTNQRRVLLLPWKLLWKYYAQRRNPMYQTRNLIQFLRKKK